MQILKPLLSRDLKISRQTSIITPDYRMLLKRENGSPEIYLDHLCKLCQRAVLQTGNIVEQAILHREADKRLLAAFISGLSGVPGKQVRRQMRKP
jgi:hypothetical protein